jgi:hypothetical protein
MPYERDVVAKLEGDERVEMYSCWETRCGLEALMEAMMKMSTRAVKGWDEAWRRFRERHGGPKGNEVLHFDPETGEVFRRKWVPVDRGADAAAPAD